LLIAVREIDQLDKNIIPQFGLDYRIKNEKVYKRYIYKLFKFKNIEGVIEVDNLDQLKPKTKEERKETKKNNTKL
jgi:hypothetical protein